MLPRFTEDIARVTAATGKSPVGLAVPGATEGLGMALWVWESGDGAEAHVVRHHRVAFEVPRHGEAGVAGLEAAVSRNGCRRVAITPAGMTHGWRMTDDALAVGLYIDPAFLDRVAAEEFGHVGPVTIERTTTGGEPLAGFLEMAAASDGILLRDDSEFRQALANALCVALIEMQRDRAAPPEPPAPPRLEDPRLQRVVEHIENALDRRLPVGELAEVAALSQFHLMRQFRAEIGETIGAYITGRRVIRAIHLLSHSDASLAEVAATCGFSSQGHFSERFRRLTGRSPAAYRRGTSEALPEKPSSPMPTQ